MPHLLCWRRRWDLDQFFICTPIVGIDHLSCREQFQHAYVFPSLGGTGPLTTTARKSRQATLAAVDSHRIGISRAELIQQISVKSFIATVMQTADKYWKELHPARNDWSSNPSESALTGIFLEAQDISLKVNETVWLHITDSLFLPSLL